MITWLAQSSPFRRVILTTASIGHHHHRHQLRRSIVGLRTVLIPTILALFTSASRGVRSQSFTHPSSSCHSASSSNRMMASFASSPPPTQSNYRPHLLEGSQTLENDWVKDLDLSRAKAILPIDQHAPRVLVLYGSLRSRSYSKLLAYEMARILDLLGAEVRIFDPTGLPMKDEVSEDHPRVQELRSLSMWSEGQVWCCPEQHGTITAVFKNQIDWIPLSLGSVRPTQGRTLAIAQVNGGSQSFNVVNILRVLGRWMRMITIPNQSSVPKAWTEFDPQGRMKPSSLRDRVVDVMEEFFKFTVLLRPHAEFLVDRYSERKEKEQEGGRLLSQAEKEARARKEKTQNTADNVPDSPKSKGAGSSST